MQKLIIVFVLVFAIGLFAGENTKTVIGVKGMKDKTCVEKITQELKKVNGVEEVTVNLKEGMVLVEHNGTELALLNTAILKAGYTLDAEKTKHHNSGTCTEAERAKCAKKCPGKK